MDDGRQRQGNQALIARAPGAPGGSPRIFSLLQRGAPNGDSDLPAIRQIVYRLPS
jgi:hypothetical protein